MNFKTTVVYEWVQATQEHKMCGQMQQFYRLKRYREIIQAWKEIKDTKNRRRRDVYVIREELDARPELARPLLALKNMLMFKAFNKLVEGAALEYDEA